RFCSPPDGLLCPSRKWPGHESAIRPASRWRLPCSDLPQGVLMSTRITIHPRIASGLALVLIILVASTTAWAQQTPPAGTDAAKKLEGVRWRAIELAGKPTPAVLDPEREVYLEFQPGGRVSGSDGCNRVAASYRLEGEHVTFTQGIATLMACLHMNETE